MARDICNEEVFCIVVANKILSCGNIESRMVMERGRIVLLLNNFPFQKKHRQSDILLRSTLIRIASVLPRAHFVMNDLKNAQETPVIPVDCPRGAFPPRGIVRSRPVFQIEDPAGGSPFHKQIVYGSSPDIDWKCQETCSQKTPKNR